MQLDDRWVGLEGVILDRDYLAGVRQIAKVESGPFKGYAIATNDIAALAIEWAGKANGIPTMKRPFELTTIFRQVGPLQVPAMLTELHFIRQELKSCSPLLDDWLLKGNTKDEAYRYAVFDTTGPTTAAIAVLTESQKAAIDPKIVSMWNGREGTEGASLQYVGRIAPETSMIVLRAKPAAFATSVEPVAEMIFKAADLFAPSVVSVETTSYFDKKVFKDVQALGGCSICPAC